jgi:hypothetical protein
MVSLVIPLMVRDVPTLGISLFVIALGMLVFVVLFPNKWKKGVIVLRGYLVYTELIYHVKQNCM